MGLLSAAIFLNKIETLSEEQLCDCCAEALYCPRGIIGGPNGPQYPRCCSTPIEELLDVDLVLSMC